MSYKVLSLKWRPKTFNEIIGQDHVTKALSNAIKLNRIAHAFIFSGPRGVGKTTTARILAQSLNNIENISDSIDVFEMDAASNRGIDEIRNLKESVNYAPAHSNYKIYIIDEVHMLTKEAFNALLKTLEEPPKYVIFILATTELHKMPETIISRTQRYDFKRLSEDDIFKQIKYILKEEKINFDQESLEIIAKKADGSMRDGLSILDQMICYCDNNIIIQKVNEALGIIDEEKYEKLLELISIKETNKILTLLDQILISGISISDFIRGLNEYLRNCLIIDSSNNDKKYKNNFSELDILRILEICLKFQINLKNYNQPKIILETLMIKLAYLDKTINIDEFLYNNSNSKKNKIEPIKTKIILKTNNELPINKISKNESSKNNNENIKVEEKQNEKNVLTIDMIDNDWQSIIVKINKINSKTAIFLENSKLIKIKNDTLYIEIIDVNKFTIKALDKDKKMIEKIINEIYNSNLSLELNYKIKKEEKKINDNNNSDKEHPLVMDALNKFKGEIIK